MIRIKVFVFNPFQENTYLLYDQTQECAIVDPGCYTENEKKHLKEFIDSENLLPVASINTHTHIDHVLGNSFVYEAFGLKPLIHHEGFQFLESAQEHGMAFGLKVAEIIHPEIFLNEGEVVLFGKSQLEILYTPGHADGSICLVSHENRFVITGDVLFNGSIGRTDLPTGNFDLLEENIRTKLYTLPDDYIVYPGHGPATSIGEEKTGNPYVKV
ncbi:MAG: MBL fold metallo-hydrolase [Bacteroidales bacterium]|nr:MBL fold metallo-hydrolase [Bacteroidales bacterium]